MIVDLQQHVAFLYVVVAAFHAFFNEYSAAQNDSEIYKTQQKNNIFLLRLAHRIEIQRRLPSFFLVFVRCTRSVCGAFDGNTNRRLRDNVTFSPHSLNTATAVPYSTLSNDTPFAVIILSFTLRTHGYKNK